MLLGSDILARLASDSNIVAAVGTQIYPEYIREADKSFPYLIYEKENLAADIACDGPTGIQTLDLKIACVSDDHDLSESVANIILGALDGDHQTTWGTTLVQGCFLKEDGISERVYTEETSEDLTLYITEIVFQIWCNAPVS